MRRPLLDSYQSTMNSSDEDTLRQRLVSNMEASSLQKPTATQKLEQRNGAAKELASGYTKSQRVQEVTCVMFGLFLFGVNLLLLMYHLRPSLVYIYLPYADFISGLVHWGADTWGSVDMPLIGKSLLRSFREHHLDPTAITKHDFYETNGNNFLVVMPGMVYLVYSLTMLSDDIIENNYSFYTFIYVLAILSSITNQIHKWSHTYRDLPLLVSWMQRCHLLLPIAHHRIHHVSPHETYYCITTGWLNAPLEYLQFWPRVENAIAGVTGVKPRADDMAWANVAMAR